MKIIEAQPAFLYAVRGDNLHKVGYTKNMPRRFAALQNNCPMPLTVAFFATTTAKAAPKAEWIAHELLAEYYHRNEWFTAPLDVTRAAILTAIAEIEAKLYPNINWFPHGRPLYDAPNL
jgi:hypothetical protein